MLEQPYPVTRKTFWAFWRRGVVTTFNAVAAIGLPWFLLLEGARTVDWLMQWMATPWSAIFGICSAVVLITMWGVLGPVYAAQRPIEVITIRPQLAAELEADVDVVAASLGVRWGGRIRRSDRAVPGLR